MDLAKSRTTSLESASPSTSDGEMPIDYASQVSRLRRGRAKGDKGEGLWLMSFSDMSLILMSFFVLQLSFSTIDKRKFDDMASSMRKVSASPTKQENLQTISKKVAAIVKTEDLSRSVTVSYDLSGLAIEFKDAALFSPGSSELHEDTEKMAEKVMRAIAKAPGEYRLIFEGHTDETPIRTARFQSNWDLSSARGKTLLEKFKKLGVKEERMSIVAYAHTRPKIKVSGLSGEPLTKARSANRRVVIRLE